MLDSCSCRCRTTCKALRYYKAEQQHCHLRRRQASRLNLPLLLLFVLNNQHLAFKVSTLARVGNLANRGQICSDDYLQQRDFFLEHGNFVVACGGGKWSRRGCDRNGIGRGLVGQLRGRSENSGVAAAGQVIRLVKRFTCLSCEVPASTMKNRSQSLL